MSPMAIAKLQLGFHSRGQQLCKFLVTEGTFYTTKESNPHNAGLGTQHGCRFIVLYSNVTSVAVVVPFYPWFKFHFSLFWSMVMSIMSLKAAVRVFINDLLNHLSFSRNNFWKWYRLRKSYSLSYNSFLTHSVLQHLN